MPEDKGCTSKLLRVELDTGRVEVEQYPGEVATAFLGGRGLGIWYLYKHMRPGTDPLSKDNLLVFASGPCNGTVLPGSGFFSLSTRSPLTGTCLSAHSGGSMGPCIRFSGFLGIVVSGAASKPVYLVVQDGKAALKDATNLWGTGVEKCTRELSGSYPGAAVAAIGPAGENLVKFSAVMIDGGRAAARGGPGCVMGSKKLKAVVVCPDTSPVAPYDPASLWQISREVISLALERGAGLKLFGTTGVVQVANDAGILPTLNFQESYFKEATGISAAAFDKLVLSHRACFACPISCSKLRSAGAVTTEGPEYESIYALGSNCGISDAAAVVELNEMCNELGLDTISAGCVIAFAMELVQRGILSSDDIGFPVKWGDADAAKRLLEMIAARKGIGDVLAEGVLGAARRIGREAERYAIHVKGLEPAGYDPRGTIGMALACATSNRGACHLRAMMHVIEVFQGRYDRFSYEGKAAAVKENQDLMAAIDSMVLCKFVARHGLSNDFGHLARALDAITGAGWTGKDLARCGERVYTLERLYNAREGFDREADSLPERFFEPLPEGPCRGKAVEREKFHAMLTEYYQARGWDERGFPTDETIKALGLDKIAL